jgi:hypothetical protein
VIGYCEAAFAVGVAMGEEVACCCQTLGKYVSENGRVHNEEWDKTGCKVNALCKLCDHEISLLSRLRLQDERFFSHDANLQNVI